MNGACERCGGTLQIVEPGGEVHDTPGYAQPGATWWPCPRCLSVPIEGRAVMALLRFGRGWLGFDPWDGDLGDTPWSQEYRCPDGIATGRNDCLPLYLSAGMDLGLRWLAHLHKLDVGFGAPWWTQHGPAEWHLEAHDDGSYRIFAHPDAQLQQPEGVVVNVPTLAAIPVDAPIHLRAARALALCVLTTPTGEETP